MRSLVDMPPIFDRLPYAGFHFRHFRLYLYFARGNGHLPGRITRP